MFKKSSFKAAWWLTNAHAQTMLAKYIQVNASAIEFEQRLTTPDQDFIDIAWTENPNNASNNKPIVVVLHGLEGSQHSHYAKGMLHAIKRQGWIGVLMHFRGCSGEPNHYAASYHSGDIKDIDFFTQYLTQHYEDRKLALIGFSLGGNVVCQYLAQAPNNPYLAASVICAPLDLASCSHKINQSTSKIYQHYLLNLLKNSMLKKAKLRPELNIKPKQVNAIKTIWQFDDIYTAPFNGFVDAADYYQQNSGIRVLNKITQPCLIMHAKDDPFMNHQDNTNIKTLPNNIVFEISEQGGHVGFISGNNPFKPVFWLEQRVPQYLAEYL